MLLQMLKYGKSPQICGFGFFFCRNSLLPASLLALEYSFDVAHSEWLYPEVSDNHDRFMIKLYFNMVN